MHPARSYRLRHRSCSCDAPAPEKLLFVLDLTDEETLKKETTKYLEIFKDHPYIFNLGHGVLPETKPEMVELLVNTVKDFK